MEKHPLSLNMRYFALFREQRGLDAEALATSAATPQALYAELSARHGFSLPSDSVRVAVNDRFVAMDTPLNDSDTVVFIPPVGGG